MNELEFQYARDRMVKCRDCDLSRTRIGVVPGHGKTSAFIMIIGEAPGYTEDKIGIPFSGKSGMFLRKHCLKPNGFTLRNTYITNTVKCKPLYNDAPSDIQIAKCKKHLISEIANLTPLLVILLGNTAIKAMFKNEVPISKMIGQYKHIGNTIVTFNYHPAFIIRNPAYKPGYIKTFEDIRRYFNEHSPYLKF